MMMQIHRNVNMIMPFTRSKFYLTAEEKRKKDGEEKQKRTEQRYSSDDSLVSPVAAAVAPDLKGFCDWPKRIGQSGNMSVLQSDNH